MGEMGRHTIEFRRVEPGDQVILTTFGRSEARGFAAGGAPDVAVCLPPGTEVRFNEPIACETAAGLVPDIPAGEQVAWIRQVSVDIPCIHHDALELADGRVVMFTQLREGQQATVVRMPAAAIGGPGGGTPRLPLEAFRALAEPADDSGQPMFI
jgi:hypothetical protein